MPIPNEAELTEVVSLDGLRNRERLALARYSQESNKFSNALNTAKAEADGAAKAYHESLVGLVEAQFLAEEPEHPQPSPWLNRAKAQVEIAKLDLDQKVRMLVEAKRAKPTAEDLERLESLKDALRKATAAVADRQNVLEAQEKARKRRNRIVSRVFWILFLSLFAVIMAQASGWNIVAQIRYNLGF